MASIACYQSGGWTAAAVASETNKEVALEIISRLELSEDNCKPSDWKALSESFGGSNKLLSSIYSNDNQHA